MAVSPRQLVCLLLAALPVSGCGVRMIRALPEPPRPPEVRAQALGGPVIQAFTANPGPVAQPGRPLTFQVVAHDPADGVLRYQWMTTGGILSTDTGQMVAWNPPARPGAYTVTVLVTNARGESTTAHLNLTVRDE